VTHLLVTNDFPPKVGGIQSYLWELWRRLPPERFAVLTTRYPGDRAFDAAQGFRVERTGRRVLVPTPRLVRRIAALAAEIGATSVVLDPALPLGLAGPTLAERAGLPYAVVLHGAEVTVPGRLPVSRRLLARVLGGAARVVAAGHYPLAEAERACGRPLPATVVPPGVDTARFRPLDAAGRTAARARFGLPPDPEAEVVLFVSRLVPRKGADVLIRAAARLAAARPRLVVAVAGAGRDRPRLERLAARLAAPVRFLGRVPDADLPALYGAADVFAVPCRNRWGGLEQEGFGIVFLEAAACGVPAVAGRSGGAAEAVAHGETGLVLDHPGDDAACAEAVGALLADPARRRAMGEAARRRAVAGFDYGVLAARLAAALGCPPGGTPHP
jgi:phosphatidylinositol alpha-1,6-mannosyltransferase